MFVKRLDSSCHLLALATGLCLSACEPNHGPEHPPASSTGSHAEGATEGPPSASAPGGQNAAAPGLTATRTTEIPLPKDLDRLDTAIAKSIREQADQVRASDDAGVWKRLGMLYHGHERLILAGACYTQSLLRNAADAEAWYYLAHTQYRQANVEEAEASLRQVFPLSPYLPARWHLALWLLERGDTTQAAIAAQEAHRTQPTDPSAALVLARVHLENDAPGEAAKILESVAVEPPASGYASFLLATAYRRLGRTDEADQALRDANSSPSWADPWLDRLSDGLRGSRADFVSAAAALRTGDWETAKKLFGELRKKQPDNQRILNNLSRAYWELREIDNCVEILEQLLVARPEDRNLHLRLGTAYREKFRGESDAQSQRDWVLAAVSHAERADTLKPGANAVALKASVVAATGRPDMAVQFYVDAADRERERPQHRARYLMRAAELHREIGNLRKSVALMDEVHGLLPESLERTHSLAVLKAQVGQFDEARELLNRALKLKPGDARVLETLRNLEKHERTGSLEKEPAPARE